ncbi:vinorine synthase-like [Melia azedarach]|uniref:Vinorine synthase-like n=1 Tax=Melia azedarach TaxID=155640 RepID=A0ACC1YAG3_MELAZ|nr:vinorine synthase-like [Melia azedarach]
MDAFPKEATWVALCKPFCKSGRCVTRRFVFDAKAILALKTKAAATISSSNVQIKPSRVEVGSAFLSKRIMNAFKTKAAASQQKQKPILLTHLVNLRRRVNPPLSEHAMGNIVWTANALSSSGEEEMDLDGLVLQLREAIAKLDEGFVQSIQGDGGYLKLREAIKDEERAFRSVEDRITFSSWCNFGLYNVDFGWGKPVWLSYVGCEGSIPNFSNHVVLVDTRCGGGIEAWVYLLEEDMNILEKDEELLKFASMDPCPVDGISMWQGHSSVFTHNWAKFHHN